MAITASMLINITLSLGSAALLLTLNRGNQSWVGLVWLSMITAGSVIFLLQKTYFDFSLYLFQTLIILFGSSFFMSGRLQKSFLGIALTALVAAGLVRESLELNHVNLLEYIIYTYASYALIPLLIYSPVIEREEDLEKTICLQQTWLRVMFLNWVTNESVNIGHYDLYSRFVVEFGWAALGIIVIGVILQKRMVWTFIQQSILSLVVICVAMENSRSGTLIYAWVLLLSLTVLLPKTPSESSKNFTMFLKRLEFGAFGSGMFWSLLLIVHLGSKSSLEGSLVWTVVIFLMGALSWIKSMPCRGIEERSRTRELLLVGSRAALQIILAMLYFRFV